MAPKKPSPAGVSPQASKPVHGVSTASTSSTIKSTTVTSSSSSSSSTTTATSSTMPSSAKTARPQQDFQSILIGLWNAYVANTPQRTKLLDLFMGFLVAVGVVQFVYCVIAGNYPFNAFLSGFSATVGQFVLTASLRMQTSAANAKEFQEISHERAFADYVFGSMILHFFCVNFIN